VVKKDSGHDSADEHASVAKSRASLYESAGQKVSSCFVIPKAKRFDTFRRALKMLNSVHGDGALKQLQVVEDVALENDPDGPGMAAYVRDAYSSEPLELAVNPKARWQEIHIIHEIGHSLDHQVLGHPLVYASDASHENLRGWHKAIEQSELYNDLRRLQGLEYTIIRRQGRRVIEPVIPAIIEYYLRPRELFARSYTQYIATTSQDNVLLRQLASLRGTKENELVYNDFWNDDDFETIATALEALFLSKGWLI
jgi:hypothetical protein